MMSTVGLTKAMRVALEHVSLGRIDLIKRPTWLRICEAELVGRDGKLTPRGHAALAAPRMTQEEFDCLRAMEAQWTLDCQGKQDYDAEFVTLSSRYYPRGGGYSLLQNGTWMENADRPHISPHASSSIYIQDDCVCHAEFSGETEAEVKTKVEEWAKAQFYKIATAVRRAFEETP